MRRAVGRQNLSALARVTANVFVLANVIFPAFYAPYVAQMFFPLAPIAALIAEVYFYRWWSSNPVSGRLVGVVLFANILSSVSGMLVAAVLPTGYADAFTASGSGSAHGADWNALAVLGWVVAFLASISIESLVIIAAHRFVKIQRPVLGGMFANAASYTVLLVVFFLSLALQRP